MPTAGCHCYPIWQQPRRAGPTPDKDGRALAAGTLPRPGEARQGKASAPRVHAQGHTGTSVALRSRTHGTRIKLLAARAAGTIEGPSRLHDWGQGSRRAAPRAIWIWLPCRRARAVVAGRGSGHGHSRFGSLARGVTAPCSLPCGNRFSRCIHRPPSIQIQDQDDDPPGRSPSVPMDPSGARQQPRARHLRGLAVPGCPTAIWPCLNPVHTLATTVPPHHSRQGR
jgi:hypothetical protein